MIRHAFLAALVLALLPGCDVKRSAAFPLRPAELLRPEAVFRLPAPAGDPFVVLTIDDGPSSRTGEILDLLAAHEAGATFFVHTDHIAGQAEEEALSRAVAEGHELAHHMPADIAADALGDGFAAAFEDAHRRLAAYGEGAAPYYRPPRAVYDRRAHDDVLARHGYDRPLAPLGSKRRYILASFIPWDAAAGATDTPDAAANARAAEAYAAQLARGLFPGAIVIFHDGEQDGRAPRAAATLVSLAAFLDAAAEKGYVVLSLSEGIERAAAAP